MECATWRANALLTELPLLYGLDVITLSLFDTTLHT